MARERDDVKSVASIHDALEVIEPGGEWTRAAQALESIPDFAIKVITAEQSNKGMPGIRSDAIKSGMAYLIANNKVIKENKDLALVISATKLIKLITSVYAAAEKQTIQHRRPASAMLDQLKPMDKSLDTLNLDVSAGRRNENSTGGRAKLY